MIASTSTPHTPPAIAAMGGPPAKKMLLMNHLLKTTVVLVPCNLSVLLMLVHCVNLS